MEKERPILFSTPMVQEILAGRKTMTRRVIKFRRFLYDCLEGSLEDNQTVQQVITLDRMQSGYKEGVRPVFEVDGDGDTAFSVKCPYGKVGDILWVRETFAQLWHMKKVITYYKADLEGKENNITWKPSIFMPKEVCRIWIEITNIRVERLKDLSQEDAKAEGVLKMPHRPASEGCKPHVDQSFIRDCFVCPFKILWNTINGSSGNGWDTNPWVWVIEFKVINK